MCLRELGYNVDRNHNVMLRNQYQAETHRVLWPAEQLLGNVHYDGSAVWHFLHESKKKKTEARLVFQFVVLQGKAR